MASLSATRQRSAVTIGLAVLLGTTGCRVLQGERPHPKVMVLTVQEDMGVDGYMAFGINVMGPRKAPGNSSNRT